LKWHDFLPTAVHEHMMQQKLLSDSDTDELTGTKLAHQARAAFASGIS
jgi:hypothetical protein